MLVLVLLFLLLVLIHWIPLSVPLSVHVSWRLPRPLRGSPVSLHSSMARNRDRIHGRSSVHVVLRFVEVALYRCQKKIKISTQHNAQAKISQYRTAPCCCCIAFSLATLLSSIFTATSREYPPDNISSSISACMVSTISWDDPNPNPNPADAGS